MTCKGSSVCIQPPSGAAFLCFLKGCAGLATRVIQVAGVDTTIVVVPGENRLPGVKGFGFRSVEWNIEDAVAITKSTFTGQTQSFEWPGAEEWYGTCELPALTQAQAAPWRSFLMQCRGMLDPFLLGDPLHPYSLGKLDSSSSPVVDGTSAVAMSKLFATRGWKPNVHGVMLAGDYVQLEWNLYTLLNDVSTDSNGKAMLEVWPSLRFTVADGLPLVTTKPRGLFRLATNKRTWSGDYMRLQHMSVPVMEYRAYAPAA